MKIIVSIFVWLLNHLWALALVMVGLVIIFSLFSESSEKNVKEKIGKNFWVVPLLIGPITLLFFFRSFVVSPLIYYFGEETAGRVISVEGTSSRYNEERVYRHHVLYNNNENKLIETSFKTSDFNVYPLANSVRYPSQGTDFTLRYMKYAPTEFVIITDETEERLIELYQERSVLHERIDFDPTNTEYVTELQEIEMEIQELEREELEKEVEQLEQTRLSPELLLSTIENVNSIHYNPTFNKIVANITYSDRTDFHEDGVMTLSLTDQKIEYIYPIEAFVNYIGYANNAFYMHNWSENYFWAISADTVEMVQLEDHLSEGINDPLIIGDYLIDYNHSEEFNLVYHLKTFEMGKLHNDVIHHILRNPNWSPYTIEQQNNRIEQLLSMKTISDYRQYFTETLENGTLISEHSSADSGLFFSDGKDDISSMIILKTEDILLRSGLQLEFDQLVSSMDESKIIGVEDKGTVYGIGMQDEEVILLKKEGSDQLTQTTISLPLEEFELESVHLDDRFLLLTKEGVFELSKEDLSLTELLIFENNLQTVNE